MTFWSYTHGQRLLDRLNSRNSVLDSACSRRYTTRTGSTINKLPNSVSQKNPATGTGWHSQRPVYDSCRKVIPSLSLINGSQKRKATEEVPPRPVKRRREPLYREKSDGDAFLALRGFGNSPIHAPKKSFFHCMKQVPRRQEHLLSLYSQYVTVDKADKKESVAVVCDILAKLMAHVRSQNGGHLYSAHLLKAGSYAIKTKIGKADEFDWLIPLNVIVRKRSSGYGTAILIPSCDKTVKFKME